MKRNLEMTVNTLPVLTYNFLHVNDSKITGSEIDIDRLSGPEASELPAGVVAERVSFAKAGEVFRSNKERILNTTGVFEAPNGDTSARNDAQALRTGMGVDVDNLFEAAGALADIYTVEEGVKAERPLFLDFKLENGNGVLAAQVIHAKKNSEITVIFDYNSELDASGFLGVSTRLFAEEGAKINIVKSQLLGKGFLHFDDIGGACFERGAINVTSLELGADKVWTGCYVNLAEKESELFTNMGYLCRNEEKLDINYVAEHRGKKTNANMQFKGVLMDQAKKTFRGTIDFRNGSSGSAGDEQEDALLLSPDVVNRSMPVILCQEEDVDGRHGATIGQLGEDLLFYMQTRGIDQEEAKRIMIRARLESVARTIPDPALMQRVEYYVQNVL